MIFKKKKAGDPQTKIEKRVAKISTPDLIMWAEQSMYSIGKHLTSWNRGHSDSDLDEVLLGAEAFLAIAKELKKRS
jgi:hypothetical protein